MPVLRSRLPLCLFLAALLAGCASMPSPPPVADSPAAHDPHAHDRQRLWRLLSTRCLPQARAGADPAPCSEVHADPGQRYALMKDLHGAYQYLLIPTVPVSGIEDPRARSAAAPNWLGLAWQARSRVADALGRPLPHDLASLTINPPSARSQDQLHIHIDCLAPQVRDQLQAMRASIGPAWAPLPRPLHGHAYRAMRVEGEELDANPLTLLARNLPPQQRMAQQTLAVVGADFDGRPGFVLLAATARPGDGVGAEELQDHECTGVVPAVPAHG
ncbi:CDP-diacylglycerol diphosphatase [Xanthomonas sp. 3498]|uniref:CDP-diacylglycerol diphosphatase n=1 Tax=Xanthomonas sp. 3498 TaxID=2663863 RepID=UPI0017D8BF67|nr:CDP-diacylglycerol diphosphatase [Xanthomonas sp. 3498]MBB5877238.1 CDP-diacylglycerol pyrophosphatase [Xanthomonas sp. 3498]